MGSKYGIALGIGAYQDPAFPSVPYAENAASGFRGVLETHGFPSARLDLATGSGASLTVIESMLELRARRLRPKDTLLFFHSGHVFRHQGRTFLSAYDTRSGDLPASSLPLATVIRDLEKSGCENVFLFLDPCHGDAPAVDRASGIESGPSEAEMRELVSQSSGFAIFAACGNGETSQASSKLGLGIWVHHLLEAFRGGEAGALEKGRYLTVRSLQAYLEQAVPKAVRTLLTGTESQTPRLWSGPGESRIILDCKRVLDARADTEASELKSLESAFFRGVNSDSVKRLSGWKKGFRVPETASLSSSNFVQSAGTGDLRTRFNLFHERIRKHLGYKRSQIASQESPGAFTCITPDFTFSISLELDARDPSRYSEILTISEIRNPAIVAAPAFGSIFDSEFDEVVMEYSREFDIAKIVDTIEAMGNPKVAVEYPPDLRECTVHFRPLNIRLRFSGRTLSYAFAGKEAVRRILEAIRNAPRILGLDRPAP